jgi:hypothetical protein
MKKSYLMFLFGALGLASLQAATPEPEYSYIAINGSTVQISKFQKDINDGVTSKYPLDLLAAAKDNLVVQIRARQNNDDGEQGTGFYVGPDLILTCYHVIKGASKIDVLDAYNHLIANATVSSWDEKCDVASLKTDRMHPKWCYLDPDTSWERSGEGIVTLGFPQGHYNQQQGTVTHCWAEHTGRDTAVFEIAPYLQEGASGSPVFNEYGVVIGIAFANTTRNSSFVVSMNAVWEGLRITNGDHPTGFVTGITDNLDLRFQNRQVPQPQIVQQPAPPQPVDTDEIAARKAHGRAQLEADLRREREYDAEAIKASQAVTERSNEALKNKP